MTKQNDRNVSMGDVDILTFVSTIHFWLADEGRRVDFVAAKEHVGRVRNSSPNITLYSATAATIVALRQLASTTASEEIRELNDTSWLMMKRCGLLTILLCIFL